MISPKSSWHQGILHNDSLSFETMNLLPSVSLSPTFSLNRNDLCTFQHDFGMDNRVDFIHQHQRRGSQYLGENFSEQIPNFNEQL